MWPLWTILLLGGLLGGLGTPLCRREPFYFLVAIMKILGDKNDGTLYTPDDLSAREPRPQRQEPRGRGEKGTGRYSLFSPLPRRNGQSMVSSNLIPIPGEQGESWGPGPWLQIVATWRTLR
nr:interleukin 15-like isoform X1 [Oryctolagus cuniculus]